MSILLFIQGVIGCLLIIVILMQKSGADGLSGLQGSPTSNSVVSAASVASFLTKITTILAIAFICNSLLLANKSSQNKAKSVIEDVVKKDKESDNNIKIAE